ncbi:MAG: DUF262 domain-containing protein [Thermotogota bacterium]|nr:DUF262 domain-containing protein [Thermotogota bacterium]
MNEDLKIQSGERLSFSKLFSEKGFQIEIPIIQRDYAQGRNSSSEVRESFLDALYNYLDENKSSRDLDFVYGSLRQSEGETCFIPLDGQQRLTTLFLLHWYLAGISGNTKTLREFLATDDGEVIKSNFTYETRTSSREFCDELIANTIDFDNLLLSDEEMENSLSKTIQDSGWYYLSWENDPTIQSMLTMLDAIHAKFKDNPEYFDRLIDTENPIITFLFLNLKEFKLTDDLYIKMNARGKPLTTFENFKAKFEQHIGKLKWRKADQRKLTFEAGERMLYPKDYFAHKIDTIWANLFWKYRNVNRKDNSYDDELMNFVRVIMANEYALTSTSEKYIQQEYLIGTLVARKLKDYTDNLTYHIYERFGIVTNNAISYLINALDVLSNGDKKIQIHLKDTYYFDEEQCFKGVLKHDLTFPQRVQFHAYLKFLIYHKRKVAGIYQWMRVVHNLSENTVIDGADEVARAIKSIEKLFPFSDNILEYLKGKNQIDFFLIRQVQEERIKAHLITKSKEWENEILKIEMHPYCKGQILFIFEFSGVLEYYEKHNNCDWGSADNSKYLNRFKKYTNGSSTVFQAILKSSSDLDYLWERAVLSKGDYLIPASAYRYNLLSTTKDMRGFSWKRLLRLPPAGTKEPENSEWRERRHFIKDVFDDKLFDHAQLTQSLSAICKTIPNDWRQYFIKNPEFYRYSEQGFIRFEEDEEGEIEILLFKHSQQNHYHMEMYSYDFYLNELLSDSNIYKPFTHAWYYEVRSSEEESCAVIDGWSFKRKRFAIDIYYNSESVSLKYPYAVCFYKEKANERDKYPDEITNILKTHGFVWKSEFPGFCKSASSKSKTKKLIQNLCAELNNL